MWPPAFFGSHDLLLFLCPYTISYVFQGSLQSEHKLMLRLPFKQRIYEAALHLTHMSDQRSWIFMETTVMDIRRNR